MEKQNQENNAKFDKMEKTFQSDFQTLQHTLIGEMGKTLNDALQKNQQEMQTALASIQASLQGAVKSPLKKKSRGDEKDDAL